MIKSTLSILNLSVSILKKKSINYIYVYDKNFYFLLKINPNTKVKIKIGAVIELTQQNKINNIELNKFFRQFYLCEFSKIRFSGKGYKIKKNTKNSLMLLFNRAHITTIFWKNILLKKLKKYKMYIKYTNVNKKVVDTIIGVRPINIFTKKGLKRTRQILLKKKGKK